MTLSTSGSPMSLVLAFTPASAAVARHELDRWLGEAASRDDRTRDDCALVVSELVGNAVRHARPLANGTLEVSWQWAAGGVDLSVTDGGGTSSPHKVEAGLSDLSGRGLAIVETLAGRWWVERGSGRTTVHALMPARRRNPVLTSVR